jgi:tripartite-type tricarboxylate transporter receptor subunit TctC
LDDPCGASCTEAGGTIRIRYLISVFDQLLAVTSTSRLKVAPEVPTFTELGYPLKLYGWIGICAANGTPTAAIQRLNRELTAVASAPEYRSRIEATGQIPEASSTEELQNILGRMSEEVSGLVTKYGIRVE